MNYPPALVKSMMQALPDDVKEALASVDTLNVILEIEKKYKLHFDQTGYLSDEVLLLTVGLTPPQLFVKNIQNRLGMSEKDAQEIGAEINEKVFRPVRESLKAIHKMKEDVYKASEIPPEDIQEPQEKIPAQEPTALTPPVQKEPETAKNELPPAPPPQMPEVKKPENTSLTAPIPTPEKTPGEIPKTTPINIPPPQPKNEAKSIGQEKLEKPFNLPPKTTVQDPYREPVN